ncbi:ribonuclease H2, subunit C [Peziza echinospora]|nr:ribonuclease H2, subunit C [Peziza echinospora]
MISIQHQPVSNHKSQTTAATTVNLLPCKFKTSSPANATSGFWKPVAVVPGEKKTEGEEEGNSTSKKETTHLSNFRGRKLLGRKLPLPENYIGVIIDPSTATSKFEYHDDEDIDGMDSEDRDEKPKECKVLGEFKEIMVWGHEELPEGNEVIWKGVDEWMGLAETMHEINDVDDEETKTK